MNVPFSYLQRQFSELDGYLADLRELVSSGSLTLGHAVSEFERGFAALHGVPHAIGVGSGTDALVVALHALGLQPGDEVITCTNTFVATVGAIVHAGGKPVLVDSENGYVIDVDQVEAAVTSRTRAILAVHYTGNVADMPRLRAIADRRGLALVEDACQATLGGINGRSVGSWGDATAFSLHPLKNLNVWGDGGLILTPSADLAARIRLYCNHGLIDRDTCAEFGINSRLDAVQAVIGSRLMRDLPAMSARQIANAARYDAAFGELGDCVDVPVRRPGVRHVYHLYIVRAKRRDALLAHLERSGVRAKIHYPRPVHLQPAARGLGYREGQFPMAEEHGRVAITLPAHPYLTDDEVSYTIEQVRQFYRS
ncbi:MAG: DegT/DnrJ/EryC1/StrS family aminotransferase [Lentisphaerae bacterium]|nr:DegT/DnrJ/EryC1/StrS family aminotransferase [Lentisphaerota bacterium]